MSLPFLNKVSEPELHQSQADDSFGKGMSLPFREPNFRKLLVFVYFWSFSVYYASPFFPLYLLRELKLSYGFVATLGMLAATADLMGMWLWGTISDRVKNKAIIRFTSWKSEREWVT